FFRVTPTCERRLRARVIPKLTPTPSVVNVPRSMHATENLKRTPLYAAHLEWGAKMVPFGGWEMPVQYSGILEGHAAVRERVGLFDISHMGEFLVAGPIAEAVLNELFSNDLRKATVGQA